MKLLLRNVGKTFTTSNSKMLALRDINLEINSGDFVCLVGPSGCGKSTLLNLIAALDKPTKGEILINDKPLIKPGTDRVMIFQENSLFPWLNVEQNVEFGLKVNGVGKKERQEIAHHYLKMVHLSSFRNSYVHELSGGMKQRVALARALALNPEVLLMDEPFAAVDSQTRDLLHEELQEIWTLTNKTIVFITHNVNEAVILGNRVIVMSVRPGGIKKEFTISFARPRKLDIELVRIANLINEELKDEIDKVVKEELDEDWAASKKRILRQSYRDLGAGI